MLQRKRRHRRVQNRQKLRLQRLHPRHLLRRRRKLPPYFTATSPDPKTPLWPDPTGATAGVWATPAGDGKGDIPEKLSVHDVYDRIAHNLFSINFVWALVAGFLVMFMQAGFMFVETGLCRAKNASHTAAMNFMIYPLGCLGFWVYGFAIGWGNWWNGPVPPGWYASLGPGLSVLNEGWGLGAAVDAAGKATGRIHLRPHRPEGLVS